MTGKRKEIFSHVAISRGDGDLLEILRKDIDLIGGIRKYVKETDTVFIKPNLVAGAPAWTGGTSDVCFVEAVVQLVKEAGPKKIIVGECGGNATITIDALKNNGYVDMCQRQNVEMADLDYAEFVEIPVENALYKPVVKLPKIVVESGVFISVPALKTHVITSVTMALKNSFGLIPDEEKLLAHRHAAVEQYLVDINTALAPDLVFLDGRLCSEGLGGGNNFGHTNKANLICVGDDPVAIDAVATRLMSQNPRARYIRWAAEKGIGNDNLDYIQLEGLSIEEAKTRFLTPAEQITQDTNGRIHIHDCCSCSQCRLIGEGPPSIFAANPNSLLGSFDVVMGPGKWDVSDGVHPNTFLLGDCIREEYRRLGAWIGGCPASGPAFRSALKEHGLYCTKCADLAEKILADYTPDELKNIRVLASAKSIFAGANNKAGMDDYLFAVGDCQKEYVTNHRKRVFKAAGVDISEYIEHTVGCCPSEEEVRTGLDRVLTRANAAKG